jgi:uncharacterized protein (UPF0276 family)
MKSSMLNPVDFKPPPLGIGLVYTPGVEEFLNSGSDALDVIEIEPQTLWLPSTSRKSQPVLHPKALELLRNRPHHKLLHGVGFPVGGSHQPCPHQVKEMARNIRDLNVPWCSEHLAFHHSTLEGEEVFTGFFLPCLQTPEGIETAVGTIRALKASLPVPFAVETAVNYLRPQPSEMPDGEFVASVCEAADCGIVLDLHNIWTNARNGRQSTSDFLAQLPLERVWEIHMAGGEEMDNYWLDAHSGAIPAEVEALAAEIIPRLPNLGAIVLEVMPARLPALGLDGLKLEMDRLRALWNLRDASAARQTARLHLARQWSGHDCPRVHEWEQTLAHLVLGGKAQTALARSLHEDPAIALFQRLIEDVRAGVLTDNFRLTLRLLRLSKGEAFLKNLLQDFWAATRPSLWGYQEAQTFGRYLQERSLPIPHVTEVLAFETARLETVLCGSTQTVRFHNSPFQLLTALGEGRLPAGLVSQEIDLEIVPD